MNYSHKSEELSSLSWWIQIKTIRPFCIYYFGPFDCQEEANMSQFGYIEDLMGEKADGITTEIKQCQPQAMTIYVDKNLNSPKIAASLSI